MSKETAYVLAASNRGTWICSHFLIVHEGVRWERTERVGGEYEEEWEEDDNQRENNGRESPPRLVLRVLHATYHHFGVPAVDLISYQRVRRRR